MRSSGSDEQEREAVIVVLDAKKRKASVGVVEWALKYLVRPGDLLLVLGVLPDDQLLKKHSSCFLLFNGSCESSEMVDDDEDMDSVVSKEKYAKRRREYQMDFQTINHLCQSSKVEIQVKLALGYCPARLAIEEAQSLKTRWILLDWKSRLFLRGHVNCNIAVMKDKYYATLMLSNEAPPHIFPENQSYNSEHGMEVPNNSVGPEQLRVSPAPAPAPYRQNPCCYPLSWRAGFPRVFSLTELETVTNGFAEDYISREEKGMIVYQGLLQDTTVLVKAYKQVNEGFWSLLKILSRVCHRNIFNLVGYCYTGTAAYMVFDYPCLGSVERNFQIEELAKKLGWRARWSIAEEIGGSLSYLHEECAEGPIVHKSVCSCSVALSHDYSAMLGNLKDAEWLDGDDTRSSSNLEEDERLFVDIRGYGKFILELITGKCACSFPKQGNYTSLIDWAMPLLEKGKLTELMDCRVKVTDSDTRVVRHMATAALRCLKVDSDHKLSISEALAIVRGDKFASTLDI